MAKIQLKIAKGGKVTAEALGFQGTSCEDALKALLNALGAKDLQAENKPEYYETAGQQTQLEQQA